MTDCPRFQAGPGDEAARPRIVDVFRRHAGAWSARHRPSPAQARLLRDLEVCRTAALGGHVHQCDHCGHQVPVYNSCRNRHCPQCQALDQARWIEAREEVLLPVGHHHLVFTLPSELRPLARLHPRAVFGLLFDAVRVTLTTLGEDVLHAHLGVTAVLHTWTRDLRFHPHLHCIVTAGGLARDGSRWIARPHYLFPVHRLKARFRAHLLRGLSRLRKQGALPLSEDAQGRGDRAWRRLLGSLPGARRWVVYTEAPFGRSTHVLRYLGRYTHRIALSDARLVSVSEDAVVFRTRSGQVQRLSPVDFIDRFLLHVLPRGFRKIRHFGLYAPTSVQGTLKQARALLGEGDRPGGDSTADSDEGEETWDTLLERIQGDDPLRCPKCGQGSMLRFRLDPVLVLQPPGKPP